MTIEIENALQYAKQLTQRERECLQCLLDGKTAKDTAQLYNISHRTIETHFVNIKKKFECKNKKQLFTVSRMLEKLGLL